MPTTDGSLDILFDYASRYPDRIVVAFTVNRRQGGARNLGIRAARAEFIGFADQDDWVEATMFEKMYAKALATDSDLVLGVRENCPRNRQRHRRIEIIQPALAVEGRVLSDPDRELLLMYGIVQLLVRTVSTKRVPCITTCSSRAPRYR